MIVVLDDVVQPLLHRIHADPLSIHGFARQLRSDQEEIHMYHRAEKQSALAEPHQDAGLLFVHRASVILYQGSVGNDFLLVSAYQ